MRVRGLPTHFGLLDLAMSVEGADRVRVALNGVQPPGGILIHSPLAKPLRHVEGDDRSRRDDNTVWLPNSPAAIVLHYQVPADRIRRRIPRPSRAARCVAPPRDTARVSLVVAPCGRPR